MKEWAVPTPSPAPIPMLARRNCILIMNSNLEKKRFAAVACEDAEKWGNEDGVSQRFIDVYKGNNDEWTKFRAISGEIPTKEHLDEYHGFVISGSRSSVNDDNEWIRKLEEFIQYAAQKKPGPKIIGICFGHQLLAKALGGIVGPNPLGKFVLQSDELQVHSELEKSPAFAKLCQGGPIRLLKSHGDCVTTLPKGAKILAKSSTCEYEMVEFAENILGLQAHPELLPADVEEKIVKSMVEGRMITKEKAEEILRSVWLPLQSSEMNEALRQYLHS